MGRSVFLSNGQLMVGLNKHGLVHDFYYPYVGLDNLTNARSVSHKIGVWADGKFSWIEDSSWVVSSDFGPEALISSITMKNDQLELVLKFQDFVLHDANAFCRRIEVSNLKSTTRKVKLFMHQVFQISRAGRADTALFVPDEPYLLDYKGRVSLLIYGQNGEGTPFSEFAVGNYGIEGKEGTFRDAEDGELSGNAVEHGGVDSVLAIELEVGDKASVRANYWVVAANSQIAAEKVHERIKQSGLDELMAQEESYWRDWQSISLPVLKDLPIEERHMAQKSMLVIKGHIDKRGGVIASGDSSIYNYGRDYYSYVWPRDAAYALWPLIRLGYRDEAKSFFEFCRDILEPDGYLMHKYQPDRAIGSTWHPLIHNNRKELAIQEDETAVLLFLLGEYYKISGDEDFARDMYETLIRPCADFMAEFFDEETGLPHASYDLWEEKFLTNTYTVFLTGRALQIAAEFATAFEYPDDAVRWSDAAKKIDANKDKLYSEELKSYRKGYYLDPDGSTKNDDTIDISNLYGAFMFSADSEISDEIKNTAQKVEKLLLNQSEVGGVIRYEHDNYFLAHSQYKGNPWINCTLWLAQYYLLTGKVDEANTLIDWVRSHATESQLLSEQVDAETGLALGVTPLVWSHAELINTLLDKLSQQQTRK